MVSRRFKAGLFVLLIALQIVLQRYVHTLKLNPDFLFLILVYISVKSGFIKTVFSATAVGLVTDYFSMQVMGVFGFSRTLIAYLLNETSKHIDLRNNAFVFLLTAVSLFLSNLVANLFFHIILKTPFQLNLIVHQPLLTGLFAVLISFPRKIRQYLDVY